MLFIKNIFFIFMHAYFMNLASLSVAGLFFLAAALWSQYHEQLLQICNVTTGKHDTLFLGVLVIRLIILVVLYSIHK
jgi:hypothetical protein